MHIELIHSQNIKQGIFISFYGRFVCIFPRYVFSFLYNIHRNNENKYRQPDALELFYFK